MTIEAVIVDWGGTLSEFVHAELLDACRLAAPATSTQRASTN